MLTLRYSTPGDADRVLTIWRDAVAATHDFLAARDRDAIDASLQTFLPNAPLWLAVDGQDKAVGFMLLDDGHMEALFIDPAWHGNGVGRLLVHHALQRHPQLTTDVNEQNTQAMGFYLHMGFVPCGRSERDGEGRPYPLIHLRYG